VQASPNTVVPLTQFQKDWITDKSRFKIATKSRRVGFTFASTLEIALDLVESRTRWLIISRTQDTAKEAMREVRNHLDAMKAAIEGEIREREELTDLFFHDIRVTKFHIELPNGSDLQALTAHPDAARGFGGHILLDEFGFHQESFELWKGASAATLRGHRVLVVSTPNYQQGKYYEIARKCGMTEGHGPEQRQQGIWSCHFVDIHTAVPQLREIGVPIDIDELRELAGDEESFAQEFGCAFLSSSEMWIALELIAAARSGLANLDWDPERPVEGTLYAGFDVGRRKDRSVIWIDEVIADVAICRGVITMDKTPFDQQEQQLYGVLAHPKLRRCSMDQTGLGMQMAERAQQKFGYKVEPVTFNLATKEDMAVRTRRRFEEKLDKIPENAPAVERAIAAIKRQATASGTLRFDAERSEAGHADEFWAKALADLAADSGSSVGPPDFVLPEEAMAYAQTEGIY
jgi:phage FluMu gp28-like protein